MRFYYSLLFYLITPLTTFQFTVTESERERELVIGWICSCQDCEFSHEGGVYGAWGGNPTMHLITDNQVAHIILSHTRVYIECLCISA